MHRDIDDNGLKRLQRHGGLNAGAAAIAKRRNKPPLGYGNGKASKMSETFKIGTWTVTLTRKGAAWTWDAQSRHGGANGFRPNYDGAKSAAEEFIALQSIDLARAAERRAGC